jgi:tetratricopeptide (TPR) repeat protein
MRIRNSLVAVLFLLLGCMSVLAQTTTVKGKIKDQSGAPVVGATVELKDIDTGRRFPLKSDKKGEFFSIGVAPGKFNVTVTKDGKVIYTTQFQARLDAEANELDIDLQQAGAQQAAPAAPGQAPPAAQAPPTGKQAQKLTPEQKKEMEEIQKKNAEIEKENSKIGNLNTMLKEAQADMAAKNYDGAIQVMQQATTQDQTHDQLFGVLGDAYLGAKKYPESAEAYSKAVQVVTPLATTPPVKQRLASYYNNLGQAYAKSNKVPEAVDAYNKAAEADPTRASQFYYNEGAVLTNVGKAEDANAAFDKAIQADPNKADAYYQKGVNSLQKAQVDKSGKMIAPPGTVDDFNKYLELQPTGPYAEQAKQILDSLGAKVTTSFKKK